MANADVNTFLANFDGGARPNRYQVEILAGTDSISELSKFSFLCRATSMPASNLSPCVVSYMGREVKVAGDRTFDDWSVTVYNNSDFGIRQYFEAWSNSVLNNLNNIETVSESGFLETLGNAVGITSSNEPSHSKYLKNAVVKQLGRKENEVLYTYEINGIFPTSISDISLAYDNNNTVEEFTVTFAVNYWMSKHKETTIVTT